MKGTVITDLVHEQIRSAIAAHEPERGGALYGPRDVPLVTHFEFDVEGATSCVSYVPSTRLIANVARIERETGLQFKGVVHSHPSGFTRPSGGDERAADAFFRLNPHFASMELPIVQQQTEGREFIRWYRAERRGASARFLRSWSMVEIVDSPFHVLPLLRHGRLLVDCIRSAGVEMEFDVRPQTLQVRNASLIGLAAASPEGFELMFCVSVDYPVVAPVVLFRAGSQTEQLAFDWQGLHDDEEAGLRRIAELLLQRWAPGRRASAPAEPACPIPAAADPVAAITLGPNAGQTPGERHAD